MYHKFFFVERECIEIKYCQYCPALWGVISNTLPLWKKEWQYTASSRNELENTQYTIHNTQYTIHQYYPPLGSVLLHYVTQYLVFWGTPLYFLALAVELKLISSKPAFKENRII